MNIGSFLGEFGKGASGYARRSREIDNEKLMKMLNLLQAGGQFAGQGQTDAIRMLGLDEPNTQNLINLSEQGIADRNVQRRGQVATTELAEKKAAAFGTEPTTTQPEKPDYKALLTSFDNIKDPESKRVFYQLYLKDVYPQETFESLLNREKQGQNKAIQEKQRKQKIDTINDIYSSKTAGEVDSKTRILYPNSGLTEEDLNSLKRVLNTQGTQQAINKLKAEYLIDEWDTGMTGIKNKELYDVAGLLMDRGTFSEMNLRKEIEAMIISKQK